MANIKKNFNFRNGVQVDDDNLLVTATGLVGIGTTIPVESLDVRGNVIITGFTSATSANIGFLTVTTFEPTNIIGAGLSVKSGIVTATGTGILTYFGDASNLQGMPTSQWEDVDVGLGFTSIYNTGGNVGVGTEDPRTTIQVGGNVDAAQRGVGISSAGNINASGIITAASFVGDLTGNIVSGSTFSGNIDLNADLDVDGHTFLDNVSVAGVTTFSGNVDIDAHTFLDNVSISGVTTTTGNVDINADVDVDGHTNLDNLSVAGVSTFSGPIVGTSGATINSVTIGIEAPSAISATASNLLLTSDGGTTSISNDLGVTGVSTFSQDVAVAGITTTKNLLVTGVTTFSGAVNATSIEVPNATITTKLGVGTTDTPVSDIQVTKTNLAEVQICSTSSIAQLNVGKEVGTGKTQTSQIRFGGGAGAPYSASGTSLDIINYDTGNFNYHLSGNNAAGVQGDFHWHKGINSARLMTLTGVGGSLGIGNTQPTKALDVTGAGNFTGDVNVGNNLIVSGALLGNVQGTLTGNVTGTLAGNTNTTVGISTLNNLSVAGVATVSNAIETPLIGIGTTARNHPVQINDLNANRILITNNGQISIKSTDILEDTDINGINVTACFGGIGIGKTELGSAVDLQSAGSASNRFVILPKVSSTAGLQNPVSGAVVYNTTTNRVQFYNGSSWGNI
jgi:cytoskeletal protein CcmA (bactofilin family)